MSSERDKIVFFDGVCHLCNGSVEFLLKNNKTKSLSFSPLQSEFAKEKLMAFKVNSEDLESILFLKNGELFKESTAALQLAKELSFPGNILQMFFIIPKFFRDWVYRIVARNRYTWFGKKDQCMIPTPEISDRFIL